MPRAGSGGHSGGHSSGGHSSSRSSGGHHIGGSSSGGHSRAGSGSSFCGGFSSNRNSGRSPSMGIGGGMRFHEPMMSPSPPRHTYYPSYHPDGGYREAPYRSRGCFSAIVTGFVLFFVLLVFVGLFTGTGEPQNTKDREKVNTGVAFQNDCIVDELGWFDNIPQTERKLQNFYNETGIQPYIVLHDYDPSLTTDEDKEAYANEYYEENIDNEGTFLFMYFAEQDVDNDVGYMCYVNGKQISSVMDAEAIDIFWNYVDNNWYSDMSTDDMFVSIFDSTAKTIMTKSTTMADVGVKVGTVVVIIVAAGAIIVIMKIRRKHEKEKAEETERILNTPISGLDDKSSSDPLVDKYTQK